MTLDQILSTVHESQVNDWHRTSHQTPYAGEDRFHRSLAIYKPDVDVTIAYGAAVMNEFQEPWTDLYSDANATSVALVLQYRGQAIYEWTFVVVDGGRYLVPMPKFQNGKYTVSQSEMQLARLFFGVYGVGGNYDTLESALGRGDVEIV